MKQQNKLSEVLYPDKNGEFTKKLRNSLDQCGLSNHLQGVFITMRPLQSLSEILMLLVVANKNKLYFPNHIGMFYNFLGGNSKKIPILFQNEKLIQIVCFFFVIRYQNKIFIMLPNIFYLLNRCYFKTEENFYNSFRHL